MICPQNSPEEITDDFRCDVLETMNIGWMQLDEKSKCLAYIKGDNNEVTYRINYCPSCGKNIRGLILKEI
jgi:hypothetical protein